MVRQEVESKVPILKEMGGLHAGLDHDVPTNIPLDQYREYTENHEGKFGILTGLGIIFV